MISKKMRNISMVCLSLVLALTLAFGLSSFSVKTADAAEYINNVANATSAVESGETVTYTYPLLNSGKLKGNTFAFEVPSNTASATLKFVDAGSNSGRYCYIYSKGEATTVRNADEEAVANSDTPGRWSLYSGSNKTHVFGFTKDDLLVTGEKSYLVIGTADDYKFKDTFTVVATLEAAKTVDTVDAPNGTYAIVAGEDLSTAGLPSEVTGNWTGSGSSSGTVQVPVTWAITEGDATVEGSTLTVTGTLGNVNGYIISAAAPTVTVSVKADERVEITAIPDFAGNADLFGTYTLPETITATTANGEVALNVTWDGEVDTSSTGDKTVNGTVTYSNVDYKLANGVDASVTATITVIDNRTVVTSAESVSYTVAQDASLTLPASVNTSEGVLAVKWDSFNTSETTTVKGSLADSNNYKLAEGVEIVANINVIENNAVSASASWTKPAWNTYWSSQFNGTTSTSQVAISKDEVIIDNDGIVVTALKGNAYANAQHHNQGNNESSGSYILLQVANVDALSFKLPAGTWTVNIGVSAYNTGSRSLKLNGATVGGENTGYDGIKTNSSDYASQGSYDCEWTNIPGNATYNLSATTEKAYIHYITIKGSTTSATYTYEEGETLLGADELPLATTGYEFIGWSNDNGATIVDAGDSASAGNYTAIFAKAVALGTSLRTTENNTGVRFGFDIVLLGVDNAGDFAANLVVKFNVYTGKDNNLTATNYALVDGNIRVNAVINNQFDAANNESHKAICNTEITTTITVTFANEKAVSANHTAVISQVAAEALAKEFISAELAAKYGVELNG